MIGHLSAVPRARPCDHRPVRANFGRGWGFGKRCQLAQEGRGAPVSYAYTFEAQPERARFRGRMPSRCKHNSSARPSEQPPKPKPAGRLCSRKFSSAERRREALRRGSWVVPRDGAGGAHVRPPDRRPARATARLAHAGQKTAVGRVDVTFWNLNFQNQETRR